LEVGAGSTYTQWRLDGSGLISHVLPINGHVLDYTGSDLIVATEAADGLPIVEVVDPDNGNILHVLPGGPRDMAWATTDPNRLITFFDDNTIGWYDLSTGARVGKGVDLGFEPAGLAMMGTRLLAWPLYGPLWELDLEAGTIKPFGDPQAEIRGVAAGPHWLYTSSSFDVMRRDPVTGAVLAQVELAGVGPAGPNVAVGVMANGRLMMVDPDTMKPVGAEFPTGRGILTASAMSADEQRLMVLGMDSAWRILDVNSRSQLGEDIDVGVVEGGAALRPDGLEMAAASDHGIVVWDLDPSHWVNAACEVAGRNLTHEEWDHYLGALGSYRATCPQS
jgi:hypothetical protein